MFKCGRTNGRNPPDRDEFGYFAGSPKSLGARISVSLRGRRSALLKHRGDGARGDRCRLERDDDHEGGQAISVRENPDLYAALCAITRDRERDKSLGWWLRRYRDRVITLEGLRYRFVRIEDKWLLDAMDEVPF